VVLLKGQVTASAWSDRPKYGVNETESDDVDFGFYLDDLWTGNRITASPGIDLPVTARKPRLIHYPCIDQGAPGDIKSFYAMMEWILEQASKGLHVDIGCMGGHGRTGLVLASLLVIQGMDPWDAIKKIRTDYCQEAVESYTQEQFVGKFWSLCNDGQVPRENPTPTVKKYTSTYTHSTQKPVMDVCPNCGNNVWYLDTHRSSCGGHPTDEELEKHKAATATTAVVVKTSNGLKKCVRDGCEIMMYSQDYHDKYAHPAELAKELDEVVEEATAEIVDDYPCDAEQYNEWLRLNTVQNRRNGVEELEITDADGNWHAEGWQGYDSWEQEEYAKRVQSVNEECPFGNCTYPMECEPTEHGGCFRELVAENTSKIEREELRGWAGDM
jgi:hypothetical protein